MGTLEDGPPPKRLRMVDDTCPDPESHPRPPAKTTRLRARTRARKTPEEKERERKAKEEAKEAKRLARELKRNEKAAEADKKKKIKKDKNEIDPAQESLPVLLKYLCDPEDLKDFSHYEFGEKSLMRKLAEGVKWAYIGQETVGMMIVWDWWSLKMDPYRNPSNPVWKAKFKTENLMGVREDIEAAIQEHRREWEELYEDAVPTKASFLYFKAWVKRQLVHRGAILDPGSLDAEVAAVAIQLLEKTFHVLDRDGLSIFWNTELKLWKKKNKEQASITLAQAVCDLVDNKICFTCPKIKAKFMTKVQSSSAAGSVFSWIRGKQIDLPSPIKKLLNESEWFIAINDCKIINLSTLEVKTREPKHLFTTTANISWRVDAVETKNPTLFNIDGKILQSFKGCVMEGINAQVLKRLEEICPNAFEFTRGPFRHPDRHMYILKYMGLFLTTYNHRKALWIFGDGKGMKSTLFHAIVGCLGDFGVVLSKKVLFSSNSGSEACHNSDLMRADGKRFLLVDELERTDQMKETIYKQLVAKQTISTREIFGFQTEMKFSGTVSTLMNQVPNLPLGDSATLDRSLPIKATTRVFNPETGLEKLPKAWEKDATAWEDQYEEETDTFWVLKDPAKARWAESFLVPEAEGGHQNELGCLLVLCAFWAYHEVNNEDNRGEIPVPEILKKDFREFLCRSDNADQYLQECTDDEKNQDFWRSIGDVYNDYKRYCVDTSARYTDKNLFENILAQRDKIATRVSQNGRSDKFVKITLRSGPSYSWQSKS